MTLMFVHCHISVYPSRATVIELSFASRLRRFCWTRALCVWFQIEVKALYERPDPHINRQECLLKVNVQPLSFNIDQVSYYFRSIWLKVLPMGFPLCEKLTGMSKFSVALLWSF